jgi:protein-tyrosine-phosphatase
LTGIDDSVNISTIVDGRGGRSCVTPSPVARRDAVHRAAADTSEHMSDAGTPTVLFVCVHNAGRSQMAAALLERRAGGRVLVRSAGSTPADEVNPAVVEAMREVGVDLASERPNRLSDQAVRQADVVVTMGCGDACPVYPGKRYMDWDLPDPAGRSVAEVRPIRDRIDELVTTLLHELTQGEEPI